MQFVCLWIHVLRKYLSLIEVQFCFPNMCYWSVMFVNHLSYIQWRVLGRKPKQPGRTGA